jgi:hypothetical protein
MSNVNTPTEILELANAASASPELSYEPVWVNTDRRQPDVTKTTLKYQQIGGPTEGATESDRIGNTYGPIFMVEFVDLSSLSATHIKIWGLDNKDADAVIYPVTYLTANPKLDIWLKKFEFTNSSGTTVAAGGAYTIYGHRSRHIPLKY